VIQVADDFGSLQGSIESATDHCATDEAGQYIPCGLRKLEGSYERSQVTATALHGEPDKCILRPNTLFLLDPL
jgi:hypothetical protein